MLSLRFLVLLFAVAEGVDQACEESGYEIYVEKNMSTIDGVIDEASVDTETCQYTISFSMLPDYTLPYVTNVSQAALFTANKTAFDEICNAEGRAWGVDPPKGSVALNEHYKDVSYSMDLPQDIQDATGFTDIGVNSDPCGSKFQPWPQTSVHFYLKNKAFRKSNMKCTAAGDFFCKSFEEQCGDQGKLFGLDNKTGIAFCPDNTTYANIPEGFSWTHDKAIPIGPGKFLGNSGSPGMGIHGLKQADLAQDMDIPFLLMVGYNEEIIAAHVNFWSGFQLGESNKSTWAKENLIYNCQDMTKFSTLPTDISSYYNSTTERTTTTIKGPAKNCQPSGGTGVEDACYDQAGVETITKCDNQCDIEACQATCANLGKKYILVFERDYYFRGFYESFTCNNTDYGKYIGPRLGCSCANELPSGESFACQDALLISKKAVRYSRTSWMLSDTESDNGTTTGQKTASFETVAGWDGEGCPKYQQFMATCADKCSSPSVEDTAAICGEFKACLADIPAEIKALAMEGCSETLNVSVAYLVGPSVLVLLLLQVALLAR